METETKNKEVQTIKSLNKKNQIQNIDKLSDEEIAILLGGEVDKKGNLIKDKNWICNFH